MEHTRFSSSAIRKTWLVAPVVVCAGFPGPLAAQPAPARPVPDSADVRDGARDAQRAFERLRRHHMPRGHAGWDCDEVVGRMCLGGEEPDWAPEPEAPEVVDGRDSLIAALDRAARYVPGDPWVLGQRVRYRVEASRTEEAISIARGCGPAERWWCAALEGFALDAALSFEASAEAFQRALAGMDEERACAWNDLSPLLKRSERGDYRDAPCTARRGLEARFWALADPLYLAPGNDRLTEHYARHVWDRLQEDASSGYDVPWGGDLREVLLRYGWPDGWDRAWAKRRGVGSSRVVQAHRLPRAQPFVPLIDWARGNGPGARDSWHLDDPTPRTAYAPPWGHVDSLIHQLARFRRGGDQLIVAAFPAIPDSMRSCSREAGLFHLAESGEMTKVNTFDYNVLELLSRSPGERAGAIVGVEVRCVDGRRAARARYRLKPLSPDALLSDLLLLRPSPEPPGTLNAAKSLARASRIVQPGDTLGVFWEWYGPRVMADPLAVTLTLAREERGFFGRAVDWLGFGSGEGNQVGLEWTETAERPGRAVWLELPDLPEGRYRLLLEIRTSAFRRTSATGELIIER